VYCDCVIVFALFLVGEMEEKTKYALPQVASNPVGRVQ
jgi:hypothetical protein